MGIKSKVTIVLLDVNNYAQWSFSMKNLLTVEGVWKFVSMETVPDTDKADDAKALSLICLHVEPHHYATLQHLQTAKEAWDTLAAIFKAKSNAMQLLLKRQLNDLKKAPTEAMTQYVARARGIRDQLSACGFNIKDQELILPLLNGLPRVYDTAVTILSTADTQYTLDDLLTKLLIVEQHIQTSEGDNDKALYSNASNQRRQNFNSIKPSYNSRPSGGRFSSNFSKDKRECFYCGIPGHIKKDCRKLARDIANKRHRNSSPNVSSINSNGSKDIILVATNTENAHFAANEWILDSGASKHITSNANILINPRQLHGHQVTWGNGSASEAPMIGDVAITNLPGMQDTALYLTDVLYVPKCPVPNLLSIKRATKGGASFVFEGNHCNIFFANKLLTTATTKGNL